MAAEGSGEDVVVKFGANIADVKAKMEQLTSVFSVATKSFMALTAVAAGGAAFSSFVEEANKLNSEAERVSRTLNITANEAGRLAMAVGDVASTMGSSATIETYEGAFQKFNRTLRTNSEELKSLGVDVDALKNGQKSSNDVFMEALKIVGEYKPGIDQTQIAMKLFGRSVGDVQVLMKVNNEALAAAAVKQKELNLTITQEGVEGARRYRAAINDVGDVLTGMKKTIGEAVMPSISALLELIASFGPQVVAFTSAAVEAFVFIKDEIGATLASMWSLVSDAMRSITSVWSGFFGEGGTGISALEVFKNALRLVMGAFVILRSSVQVVVITIKTAVESLSSAFSSFANVAWKALTFDFKGAAQAAREGLVNYGRIVAEGAVKVADTIRKGKEDLDDALLGTGKAGSTPKTPAGTSAEGGSKTAGLGKDDGMLQARNALQRTMQEASLNLEREYLRQAGEIYQSAYAQNLITTKEFYDAKLAMELRGIDASIEAKKKEADNAGKSAAGAEKAKQRLQFQTQEKKLLGEIAVLEAQRNGAVRQNAAEYEAAELQRTDALKGIRLRAGQEAIQGQIDQERGAIDQMRSLGQIGADQALEMQRSLEARRFEAARAGLVQRQELARGDLVKQAELNAELEGMDRDHQNRLMAIDRQAELDKARYQLAAREKAKAGFEDSIRGQMNGAMKLSDAFKNFALSVAKSIDDLVAKKLGDKVFDSLGGNQIVDMLTAPFEQAIDWIIAQWTAKEATQTAATTAGVTARVAAETAGEEESLLVSVAGALKRIAIAAWEAAASVYASIAAIPYVGPFLAPAMAVGASVAVLGFAKNIASAEGGWWQIPSDQVANVHKNEMVIPAAEASGLRGVIASASQASGGVAKRGGDNYHLNVQAMDAASVERLFMQNGHALVRSLRKAGRDSAS